MCTYVYIHGHDVIHPNNVSANRYVLKRKHFQDDQLVDNRTTDNGPSATPSEDEPPPAKRHKKQRGQNKHRPRAAKISLSEMLCPSLYHGNPPSSSSSTPPSPACKFGERCRYCHDCATFLSTKPPDLGDHCYIFETFGRCQYGLACRYGNSHMTSDHRNVTNEELFDPHRVATTINVITRSLQEKLRKRKLELPKSEAFLRSIGSATSKGGRKDAKERGEGEMKSVGGGGGTGEGSMQEITEDMQSGNSVGASYTEQSCSSIQSFTEDGTKMAEGDSATCSSEGAQEVVGCEGVGEGVRDGGVRGEDGESDGGRVTGDEGTGVKEGGRMQRREERER